MSSVSKLLDNQAVNFIILRDPVDQFISMWDYYASKKFNTTLEKYMLSNKMKNPTLVPFLDLGLPKDQLCNFASVKAKIIEIEQTLTWL